MRHARVAGSCHGLRDSIVTLRDWAVTSAASAIVQLPLSAILEFTQHDDENCSQSHGPVQSFAPLLSIVVMPGLVSGTDISALWIWASGDVTADNEARVGVTMGLGVMMVVNTGERLRLVRDGGVTRRVTS